jgi:hypothetical protein
MRVNMLPFRHQIQRYGFPVPTPQSLLRLDFSTTQNVQTEQTLRVARKHTYVHVRHFVPLTDTPEY